MQETTSFRLKKALDIRNMKQVDLVSKTGIGKSAISQYLAGKVIPKQDKIYLMADALDVSPSWLMGYDVPMENIIFPEGKKNKSADDELAENVIIYHRNGGTVKKTFSKEDMELLTKMIEKLGQDDYDNI